MISVVIPVFNAGRYLSECIGSVLDSDYPDFELILVNDGSTDNSLDICQQYRERDSRVQVLDGPNRGASGARNEGINRSRGEWIVFVDADDLVCPDFLSLIAQQQNADLLVFDYSKNKACPCDSGDALKCIHVPLNSAQDRVNFIARLLEYKPLAPGGHTDLRAPWAKAFRTALLDSHAIRFTNGISVGEDALFNIEYAIKARSCIYVPRPVYLHRTRSTSASHKLDSGFLDSIIKLQHEMLRALMNSDLYPALRRAYDANALENIAYVLIRGIFASGMLSASERKNYCDRILEDPIFQQALEANRKIGNLPRRIILELFRRRLYGPVCTMCRACHAVLNLQDRAYEKKWEEDPQRAEYRKRGHMH